MSARKRLHTLWEEWGNPDSSPTSYMEAAGCAASTSNGTSAGTSKCPVGGSTLISDDDDDVYYPKGRRPKEIRRRRGKLRKAEAEAWKRGLDISPGFFDFLIDGGRRNGSFLFLLLFRADTGPTEPVSGGKEAGQSRCGMVLDDGRRKNAIGIKQERCGAALVALYGHISLIILKQTVHGMLLTFRPWHCLAQCR
jgi:hypothetical protein